VESGGRSGTVTDDSEAFRLDNWEFELDGGTCGSADRSGKCKNGPIN